MTSFALLGHGVFEVHEDPYDPEDMGVVAIDKGTTLQTYSDTGQALGASKRDFERFRELVPPWQPMTHANLTWNFQLTSALDILEQHEKGDPGFFARVLAPHVPLLAGRELSSPALLCTGNPRTCPTDISQVHADWTHTCSGILGQYKGELHWLACTEVFTDDAEVYDAVEAARGAAPAVAILGADPDSQLAQKWYELERANRQGLDEFWDALSDDDRQALLADGYIWAWYQTRPVS
jgi:hypothetical protein